jgi:protein-S-isoprenylcysteine O-methyltransferase
MSNPTSPISQSTDMPDGFEDRLRQRSEVHKNPLSTIPANDVHKPQGKIPNTPLAASTISFLLGSVFSPALLAFVSGGLGKASWPYYQLGFFVAAWAGFHWGEFAITAGWNLDKCSVDCKDILEILPDPAHLMYVLAAFLLENGAMYHIANGIAVVEYLVTFYFKPSFKFHPYISMIGEDLLSVNVYLPLTS